MVRRARGHWHAVAATKRTRSPCWHQYRQTWRNAIPPAYTLLVIRVAFVGTQHRNRFSVLERASGCPLVTLPARTGLYLRSPWPHGIVPQAVMALHVFVAQAYRVDSLPKHRLQGELDLAGSRWPVKQAAKRPKTSNVWSASRSSSDPVSGDIGSPSNVPTTCATAPSPRNEALPYDHFAPLQRKGWL